ncbi:MAG: CheR family methyltransferase [Bdellovibrionales bacterium]
MVKSVARQDIERLAEIVREETGNQVMEKNFSMIESRIRAHLGRLGIEDMQAYWDYFEAHEELERDALQSLMTTHYTFFFREFAHFEILEKWWAAEKTRLMPRHQKDGQPIRIWSAACSRGQEVYSLAMFLDKRMSIPFEIFGSDVDAESVAFARNGVYPLKEVNTIPHEYLAGYWKKGTGSVKDYAAIHPNIKKKVSFQPLNLLELDRWSDTRQFDVIFCRNVFIYFSDENVQKIASSLAKRLSPGGLFISGMSEPLRFKGWDLNSIGPSAYQKAGAVQSVEKLKSPQPKAPTVVTPVQEKARVLCVDDSGTIQLLMKKIFASDPTFDRVETAMNGREAREKLDKGKFDLITLDIHMPEVNGIEFLERLYKRKSDPPVLMVSSVNRTDLELATKSLSLGAFDYVEKPAMNNLQKSASEILTKAKMALRSKELPKTEEVGGFDQSIGQKIVVPDASQCLRLVFAGQPSRAQVEQLVKFQEAEYRSPALLIVWRDQEAMTQLEADILTWTKKTLAPLRKAESFLRPNHVYVLAAEFAEAQLKQIKAKSLSVQFLDVPTLVGASFPAGSNMQVLVDEALGSRAKEIERLFGVRVSDITPATSFASLSVEFFANLRKAA